MKKKLLIMLVLVLTISMLSVCYADEQNVVVENNDEVIISSGEGIHFEFSSNELLNKNSFIKSAQVGYLDIDFYFQRIPSSNVYQMYYNFTSNHFINGIIYDLKVSNASVINPIIYLSKSVNDGFPMTLARYGKYLGNFSAQPGTTVYVSTKNFKFYDCNVGSWISLPNWQNGFYLN